MLNCFPLKYNDQIVNTCTSTRIGTNKTDPGEDRLDTLVTEPTLPDDRRNVRITRTNSTRKKLCLSPLTD